jgi:DNA polymerase zeta
LTLAHNYFSAGYLIVQLYADVCLQSGRSTLEWTIRTIHAHPEWRGQVVYGDTDSVFVHLMGRTKDEAFRIGQEISDFITAKSPAEVVLKFEKVYFPSVLVTKKRYVGFMYETPGQKRAHFEAKGIEVVRRDQCPATVKMQEKVLRILFETRDMSKVKEYLAAEWAKMMQGGDKLLLKDFIFSKEVTAFLLFTLFVFVAHLIIFLVSCIYVRRILVRHC